MSPRVRERHRMSVLLHLVLGLVIAILLAQLWLFTVTIEATDGSEASVTTVIAALICSLAGSATIWLLIRRVASQ